MKSVDGDAQGEPDSRPAAVIIALDGDDDGDSDGDGTCIARARHLMADFLGRARADHGMAVSTRAVGLAQLVVSELVTNAHKYAPGPLRMELRIVDDAVEVTVRDGVRVLPVARPVEPGRVGQHGLEIVMAVVQAFQVRLEPAGKSVTARIALTDGSVGPR